MWSAVTSLMNWPVVVLLIVAIVTTLARRAWRWAQGGACGGVTPAQLRKHVDAFVCVPPGQPLALQLLDAAQCPARVRLHVLKMLAADEAAPAVPADHAPRVRLVLRHGALDAARERARFVASAACTAPYVLLLGDAPVEAAHGWDRALLKMLGGCAGRRPVLTARLLDDGSHGFLAVAGGAIEGRPFAVAPPRPQPSPWWSADLSFGPAAAYAALPPPEAITVATEDLLVSRALWMHGADFYCPNVQLFRAVGGRATPPRAARVAEWAPPADAARTQREWAAFTGQRQAGRWCRRARLGLTAHPSAEERYAKYGGQLEAHGL